MSSYDDLARGQVQGQAAPKRRMVTAALSDVLSPAMQLTRIFPFQSYFDSTLQERALLTQDASTPLVVPANEPNRGEVQIGGYAIGLHPSSQTPVAIEFKVGGSPVLGQASSGSAIVMKPGQVIRPYGTPEGRGVSGAFSGFRVGLPFGWLGGGMATLVVFSTPVSNVLWHDDTEIIFHRQRVPIRQPAQLTAAGLNNAPYNWPLRFPWPHARRGTDSIPQAGQGQLGVSPTRTGFTLRGVPTLLADANFRLIFQATNDFGVDANGAPILTDPVSEDWTFRAHTSLGVSGNLATQNPCLILSGLAARLGADNGGMVIVDASGTGALAGGFMDVVRYGRL